MTDELHPSQFAEFFEALHGYEPFPWQERLAHDVCENKPWPKQLDLPTGAGKTSAIDIAVFHLAYDAISGSERRAPVRIVSVVDRRLVVDATHERGRKIANKLKAAETGILRTVAERLRKLAGDGEAQPLVAVKLRGGTPREGDWARSPCQPTICASTVDQVGSRLLFRGYGVSDRMKPVHAGLLGGDVLFLIDEAHLSRPFLQTLNGISDYRRTPWLEKEPQSPFHVVSLSATQDAEQANGKSETPEPVILSSDDHDNEELAKRLRAKKLAHLKNIKAALPEDLDIIAEKFAEEALQISSLGENPDARVVLVVVNRVPLARKIYEALRAETREAREKDEVKTCVELMIGRARALDRKIQAERLMRQMRAGRDRSQTDGSLILVATQCIEVGADIDADALVSQLAPLDCLRQRFGRLDRLGNLEGRASAVILATKDQIKKESNDPVYGEAPKHCWEWLATHAKSKKIDFGIEHMDELLRLKTMDAETKRSITSPRADAPILLPVHLNLWNRTWPRPAADPEVALFLHGPERTLGEVQIAWRADLSEETLLDRNRSERCKVILDRMPPSALETITLPVWEARRWLRQTGETADLSDVISDSKTEHNHDTGGRPAFRWDASRSRSGGRVVYPNELRPGDLLIVPSAYGGCDDFGWAPDCTKPVTDLSERANIAQRGRCVVRLHRDVLWPDAEDKEKAARWRKVADVLSEYQDDPTSGVSVIADLEILPDPTRTLLKFLSEQDRRSLTETLYCEDLDTPYEKGAIFSLKKRLSPDERRKILRAFEEDGAVPDEEDSSGEATTETQGSFTGVEVSLRDHSVGVARRARNYAVLCGLGENLAKDIERAALFHDVGKAEVRFQASLRGSDKYGVLDQEPIAKSKHRGGHQNPKQSEFPPQGRHEAISVHLAARALSDESLSEHSKDLILYLIGTHHGFGRPFFPPVEYPEACKKIEVSRDIDLEGCKFDSMELREPPVWRLDSDWVERLERLKRRFGPWELARMEAILRLADHRQSEYEQQQGRKGGK